MRRLVVVVLAVVAWGCMPPPYPGAVKPAPPGPVDLVRSMWGDYGGRCPDGYQYCATSSQPICCPFEAACAEDSGGAYCAPRGQRSSAGDYGAEPGPSCPPNDITCSYRGATTCCASYQRCCAVNGGPACCEDAPP